MSHWELAISKMRILGSIVSLSTFFTTGNRYNRYNQQPLQPATVTTSGAI